MDRTLIHSIAGRSTFAFPASSCLEARHLVVGMLLALSPRCCPMTFERLAVHAWI